MKASDLKIGQYVICKDGRYTKSGTVEKIQPRKKCVVLVRYAGLSNPKPIRTILGFDDDIEPLLEKHH